MKKVRIMLAAIIVMGSVGGALAFKAKMFTAERYCYKTNAAGMCTGTVTFKSAPVEGLGTFYYTTTNNIANCPQANCPNRALRFDEAE